MKKIICIAIASFMIFAMSFNINYCIAESVNQSTVEPTTNENFADNQAENESMTDYNEETTIQTITPNIHQNDNSDEKIDITNINDSDKLNLEENVTEYICVEDIELAEFNDEMYVDETQNLSATVIPSTATNQNLRYSSSNSSVAKVNSIGKLTAVGKGKCRIYITCDDMSVYYDLTVKVKTEVLNVKSKYIILKPEEQFNLEANAQPADSSQNISFKSNDEAIAVVGPDGIITAKSVGSTLIIVSNEDTTIMVNVIVNTEGKEAIVQNTSDNISKNKDDKSDNLTEIIKNTNDKLIVVKGIKKISSSALKELYGTDKTLTVELDDYCISIRGQDIFNANNEINTQLNISNSNEGMSLKFIEDEKLPGTISITLKNAPEKYKYFYLVNEHDYQRLNSLSNNELKISSVGEYLLSVKNMDQFKINITWVLGGIGVILLLSVIYIFSKKKYWFW